MIYDAADAPLNCIIVSIILVERSLQGMVLGLYGPSLTDLAELLNCSFTEISYSSIGRGVAYCIAALLCEYIKYKNRIVNQYFPPHVTAGIVYNKVNRQLGLMISLVGLAVATTACPMQRHLPAYYAVDACSTFFLAAVDVACAAWMLEMWQEKANMFMLIMGLGQTIGQTVSQFLVSPFLSVAQEITTSDVTNSTAKPVIRILRASRIVIPYSIIGAVCLGVATVVLIMYLKSPFKQQDRSLNKQSSESKTKRANNDKNDGVENHELGQENVSGSRCYNMVAVIFGCLLYATQISIDTNTLSYLPQFLMNLDPPTSKEKATLVLNILIAVMSVGLGLTILISSRVNVHYMLYFSYTLSLGGNLLLMTFAATSEKTIWVSVVILGIGHSNIYMSIWSVIEQKINVTNFITGLMMTTSSATLIGMSLTMGHLVESHPFIFVYYNLFGVTVALLILTGFVCA